MELKWVPSSFEQPFDRLSEMVHELNVYYRTEGYEAFLQTNNITGEPRVIIERDAAWVDTVYDVYEFEQAMIDINNYLDWGDGVDDWQ